MDHDVKVEEETNKQKKYLKVAEFITLLREWQATLLAMKCRCKDLMESENQGFLWGGGQAKLQWRRKKKKLRLLEVKPYSEFFKNPSCEYVL